jgi:CheY-like chemotaxis protein
MSCLILSAGRDPELLKSRNIALSALGYKVAAASDSVEIVDRLLNGDFDLVLLCHSIPDEDRLRITRIVARYTPSTPVVLVSQDGGSAYAAGARIVQCRPNQIMSALTHSIASRSDPRAA